MPRTSTPAIERFYRHVRQDGECLIWTGTVAGSKTKRATFRCTTRSSDPKVYAHRWIYEQRVGPIPDGWEVDHLCKRGLCVKVAHLEAVPSIENKRRERLGMCTKGLHDLNDPQNCDWDSQGRRRGCRMCRMERDRRRTRHGM